MNRLTLPKPMSWLLTSQLVLISLLYFGALAIAIMLSFDGSWFSLNKTGLSLNSYREVLSSSRIGAAFLTSLMLAGTATVIAVPLGLLSGSLVIRLRSSWSRLLIGGIMILPLLSSAVLRMLGFSLILSDGGPVSSLICTKLEPASCHGLLYTVPAIVIGLVSNILPICALIFFVQLLRVSHEQILAARNLGANTRQVWWWIELPQCGGALIVSIQLSVISVLGDLLAPSILGGNVVYTYAAALNDHTKIDDWSTAAVMALLVVILVCAIMATFLWLTRGPTNSVSIQSAQRGRQG